MANPTLLDMPIARDGNKNTIPTTDNGTTGLLSQQYGWQLINAIPPQQGGKAVKREDFNGALYLLSNLLFYLQKGWQFEWDPNQAYYAGCVVKDPSDGKMYRCINDVTSTTAPHSDSTNWELWDLSQLANYLPLSGGLLTNYKIGRDIDTGEIMIVSGADYGDGACLLARGKNYNIDESAKGSFQLEARLDASTYAQLIGLPSGDLTWQTNSLDKAAVTQENMDSNGYRQTADGFTVCWGVKSTGYYSSGEFSIVYPITFTNAVIAVVPTMVNNGTAEVPCEFVIRSMNESQATVAWRTYNGTTNVDGGVFWVAYGI
jgi:hypothetical protein